MNLKISSPDYGGTPSDREAQSIGADAGKRFRRGVHAVRIRARRLTAGARRVSEGATNYAKNEPIKALLIALAVGAALSAVVRIFARDEVSSSGTRRGRM
jgi:ElaB/YqjD/DUF883 family membrane-anchored ribosome-binding protein